MSDAETNEVEEVQPGQVKVTASKEVEGADGEKEKKTATVYVDIGASAAEMIERYGDELVYDLAIRSARIKAQSQIREALEDGQSQDEIASEFEGWRPDIKRTPTRDPMSNIRRNLGKLSEEDRQALLAELQADLDD